VRDLDEEERREEGEEEEEKECLRDDVPLVVGAGGNFLKYSIASGPALVSITPIISPSFTIACLLFARFRKLRPRRLCGPKTGGSSFSTEFSDLSSIVTTFHIGTLLAIAYLAITTCSTGIPRACETYSRSMGTVWRSGTNTSLGGTIAWLGEVGSIWCRYNSVDSSGSGSLSVC